MSAPLIRRLDFLTPGSFPIDDPATGLREQVELFRYAEELGFDGGWVRRRHLESNLPSPLVFLAAVASVTRRIELGPCVVPLALENLWTTAEDFSVLDALAPGRVNVGVSGGVPTHPEVLGPLWAGPEWAERPRTLARVLELVDILRGDAPPAAEATIVSPNDGRVPARLQPARPELADRVWYGGISRESAIEAARAGLAYTTAIMTRGRASESFFDAQLRLVDGYLGNWSGPGHPRFMLGRTLLPTDSADAQAIARYAARTDPRRAAAPVAAPDDIVTIPSPDVVGSSELILEALAADPVLRETGELRVELPYAFSHEDNRQILHDVRTRIAPELGWAPARTPVGAR